MSEVNKVFKFIDEVIEEGDKAAFEEGEYTEEAIFKFNDVMSTVKEVIKDAQTDKDPLGVAHRVIKELDLDN